MDDFLFTLLKDIKLDTTKKAELIKLFEDEFICKEAVIGMKDNEMESFLSTVKPVGLRAIIRYKFQCVRGDDKVEKKSCRPTGSSAESTTPSSASSVAAGDIAAKLDEIRKKRLAENCSTQKPMAKKKSYTICIGVKKETSGQWRRNNNFLPTKLNVDSTITYEGLLDMIKSAYGITGEGVLLDGTSNQCQKENFSLTKLVAQRQYTGTTRIYLGMTVVKEKELKITQEKVKCFLRQEFQQQNLPDGLCTTISTEDVSVEQDCPRIRMFMHRYQAKFKEKDTVYGKFILLPKTLLKLYTDFNLTNEKYCHIEDIALQYFLQQRPGLKCLLKRLGNGVVELAPGASDEFEDMKSKIIADCD